MIDTLKEIFTKSVFFLKMPVGEIFNTNRFQWSFGRLSDTNKPSKYSNVLKWDIAPFQIANLLRIIFIVATSVILLSFILSIFQYPNTQAANSPMTYYQVGLKNDPSHLFSKKIVHLEGVKIQGLILTKESPENTQGYVIFDIDGKNVGPVEVGETFGKGLFLKAITNNSATITYQGQKSTIYLFPEENPTTEKK